MQSCFLDYDKQSEYVQQFNDFNKFSKTNIITDMLTKYPCMTSELPLLFRFFGEGKEEASKQGHEKYNIKNNTFLNAQRLGVNDNNNNNNDKNNDNSSEENNSVYSKISKQSTSSNQSRVRFKNFNDNFN
jgi:hypothetical protein